MREGRQKPGKFVKDEGGKQALPSTEGLDEAPLVLFSGGSASTKPICPPRARALHVARQVGPPPSFQFRVLPRPPSVLFLVLFTILHLALIGLVALFVAHVASHQMLLITLFPPLILLSL